MWRIDFSLKVSKQLFLIRQIYIQDTSKVDLGHIGSKKLVDGLENTPFCCPIKTSTNLLPPCYFQLSLVSQLCFFKIASLVPKKTLFFLKSRSCFFSGDRNCIQKYVVVKKKSYLVLERLGLSIQQVILFNKWMHKNFPFFFGVVAGRSSSILLDSQVKAFKPEQMSWWWKAAVGTFQRITQDLVARILYW